MNAKLVFYSFDYYSIGFMANVYCFLDAIITMLQIHFADQYFDSFEFVIRDKLNQSLNGHHIS